MKAKLFGSTLVVVLSRGEKLVESLKAACAANCVNSGSVSGIGSVLSAELQSYRAESASYADFSVPEPCEIVSLLGNISLKNGSIHTHLHISLADSFGAVRGGHLNEAVINGNCEIFVNVLDSAIERRFDPATGISPFDI